MATPAGKDNVGASGITRFTIEQRVNSVKPLKVRGKKATLRIVNDRL
jgi:hypothetical protein